jgi:hypothetical protein
LIFFRELINGVIRELIRWLMVFRLGVFRVLG